MAPLIVTFYMNDQGEVLDNVQHPVNSPWFDVPVLPTRRVLPLSVDPPETVGFKVIRYRAVRVSVHGE